MIIVGGTQHGWNMLSTFNCENVMNNYKCHELRLKIFALIISCFPVRNV